MRLFKKKIVNKSNIPVQIHYPSSTYWNTTTDITPTAIRNAIDSDDNVQIQDMIDSLIRSDSHLLGKIKDRLSVFRKIEFNWTGENEKQIEIMKELIEPKLTKNIMKHLLDAVFRRFAIVEIEWKRAGQYWDFDLKKLPQRAFEYKNSIQKIAYHENELYLYDGAKGYEIPEGKIIKVENDIVLNGRVFSLTEIIALLVVIKYYALQKDWTRYNELFGLPFRLGTYEEGANQKDIDTLYDTLKNLGSAAYGIKSALTKIEFLNATGTGNVETFDKIIQLCNSEMSKAIVGQSGTSEGGKEASYASMKVLDGVREDIAKDSVELVQNAFNEQLVRPFCLYNFGTTKNTPTLEFQFQTDYKELIEMDEGLQKLGVKFKKEYLEKRYPINDEDFDLAKPKQEIFNALKKKVYF